MEKIYKFKYINWLNLSGKLSDALLSKNPYYYDFYKTRNSDNLQNPFAKLGAALKDRYSI